MVGGGVSAPDVISCLPNNVIENILIRMPLRDAVKTSVLSKTWRHAWETLPQLVFDSTLLQNRSKNNELLFTICRVLLHHRGPILSFSLSLSQLESSLGIDTIMLLLSRKGIEELTLRFRNGQDYKLPPSFFSCLELKSFDLSACLFKIPATFNGFSKLVNVYFENVDFDSESIRHFIFKCPLLEDLKLANCKNIGSIDICATNLKFLRISSLFYSIDSIDISAPNLVFLRICSLFKSIYFRDTPLLKTVMITEPRMISRSTMGVPNTAIYTLQVFGCLPNIECLCAGFYFSMGLTAGDISKMLPTPFNHLKYLFFSQICLGEAAEMSRALWLIRSSPYLRLLGILGCERSTDNADAVVELLKVRSSDVSLCQLQDVKIRDFQGTKSEVEFVKFLLAKSPSLKTFEIHIRYSICDIEQLRIVKATNRFPRASTAAEIIYV